MKRFFTFVTTISLWLTAISSFGATFVWDGGGFGNDWTNPFNWDLDSGYPGDSLPVEDDVIILGGVTVDIDGAINGITTLTLTGNLTNSANGDLSVAALTTLNGTIDIGTGDMNLAAVTLGGNSSIGTSTGNAASSVTITGTVDGNGSTLTVDSNASDLILDGSTFTDFATLNLATDFASVPFDLPNINTTVALNVTAGSAIGIEDNAATITVSGAADVTGGAATLIDLTTGTINLASFSFFGDDVSLTDTNGVTLSGGTAAGNFTLAAGGNITADAAAITVSGITTLDANTGSSDILLAADNKQWGRLWADGTTVRIRQRGAALVLDDIAAGIFELDSDSAVTQAGGTSITAATGVDLIGAGPFTLTQANTVAALAANTTGAVSFTVGAGGLAVGTVDGTIGITTTNDLVTLTSGGGVTINDDIAVGAGGLTITAADDIVQGIGDTITCTGTTTLDTGGGAGDDILLANADNQFGTLDATADTLRIRERGANLDIAGISAALAVIDSNAAVTQSGPIDNGSGTNGLYLTGAGQYVLDDAGNDIGFFAADLVARMDYYDSGAFEVGTVDGNAGIDSTDNVTLSAGGNLTQTQIINSSMGLRLLGNGPFVLGTLDNTVTQLAVNVNGAVAFRDAAAGGLEIDNVQTLLGITTSDDTVTLTTVGALNINEDVNVGAGDFIVTSGGNIAQQAGDTITCSGTATLSAVGNTIDLDNATNAFGTLGATAATVRILEANALVLNAVTATTLFSLNAGAGGVTQNAGQIINAPNLELLGTGPYTLTQANTVTTFAANTADAVSLTDDTGDLAIGTVDGTVGVQTSGGTLTITPAGALNINEDVDVGAGDFIVTSGGNIAQQAGDTITCAGTATLDAGGNDILLATATNAFGTLGATGATIRILEANALVLNAVAATTLFSLNAGAGGVTQNVGQIINSPGVELLGAGPYTLTQANTVTTLAATTAEAIAFTDGVGGLTIGSVDGTNGIATTADDVVIVSSGGALAVNETVTTAAAAGDIDLTSSATIDLDAALTAGTGDIVLNAGAAVSQTVAFTGSGLLLEGAGPFALDNGGAGNNIQWLAADSVTGYIDYIDVNAFAVDTVNGVPGVITNAGGATVSLENLAGDFSVNDVITTADEAVTVVSAGNIAVNPGGSVTSDGGTGANIDFTAAGTVDFDDTVDAGTVGIVVVDADGAVNQSAVLSGVGLQLLGDGPFDLSTQDNLFTDIAANVTAGGTVAYNDANAIDIDNVGGTPGITTVAANIAVSTTAGAITVTQAVTTGLGTAGNVTLAAGGAGGNIDVNNLVVSGSGNVILDAGGTIDLDATIVSGTGYAVLDAGNTVSQTIAVTAASGLELLGVGPFDLNIAGGNEVDSISANVTGYVDYIDADALTVTTVGTTTGIAMGAADLTLETLAGDLDQDTNCAVSTTGSTNLTAGSGANGIYLNDANNAFGTLTATGNEVRIRQSGAALDLAAIDAARFTLESDSAVTQSGAIDDGSGTNELLLTGAGPFLLDNVAANDIGTLAANVAGELVYYDSDEFDVGSVTAANPAVTVNGVTGTGIVSLRISSGTLDQTQAVRAQSLLLTGTGAFNLDAVAANDADTFAANVTGQLDFEDTDAVSIGTVADSAGGTADGIATNGGQLDFLAGGGITIAQPVATGAGEILVFDSNDGGAGSIIVTEVNAADTITTAHANGISLNDPIELRAITDFTASGGSIALGALATVNDDGAVSDYDFTLDAAGGITLGADIGAGTPPRDVILVTGGGNSVIPAAGVDVEAGRDVNVAAGSIYVLGAQSIIAGQDIAGGGTVTISSTATLTATRDITIATITVGDVTGVATLNVGHDFTSAFTPGDNLDNDDADSTVIFNNVTAAGSGSANSFHNLTINDIGDAITSTGSWTVYGTLSLTNGRWDLNGLTHTVWGNWNSSGALFNFDAAGATVVFAGDADTTVTTDGIGAAFEMFDNITVSKDAANTLALASDIQIDGNLAVTAGGGALVTGNNDIQIEGNWTYDPTAAAFDSGAGGATVTFVDPLDTGTASVLSTGGAGNDFRNLVIDDCEVQVVAYSLAVNNLTLDDDTVAGSTATLLDMVTASGGTLTLTVANNLVFTKSGDDTIFPAPVLDLNDWSLDVANDYDALITSAWPAPYELGRLRITGSPVAINRPYASDAQLGTVEFYGAAADLTATVFSADPAPFWHIIINGCVVTLGQDITVLGHSGVEDGALTEPVESSFDPATELMGIYITGGGSLDVNGNTVNLYGSFNNTVGAAGFDHGNGGFVLLGDYPALIAGGNTFYGFTCSDQSGGVRDVGGKIVYFEQGTMTTIVNDPAASFIVRGETPPASYTLPTPLPDAGSSWVFLISSNNGVDWEFNKGPSAVMDIEYVYLRDSDATSQPQVLPGNGYADDCLGWFKEVYVDYSYTQDLDGNGRIDAILVTSVVGLRRFADGAYDDVEISVNGYTVTGLSDGPLTTQFFIDLAERDSLDTGATPAWRFESNVTLIDNGTLGAPLAIYPAKGEEIPYDEADPVIGYTLAVADSPRNEVFIHFSEPLESTDGTPADWTDNFNMGGLPALTAVTVVTPALGSTMQEALLVLSAPVSAADIYGNNNLTVVNVQDVPSPASGYAEDAGDPAIYIAPNANVLADANHRVSDVALGILGNGIVEPVVATGNTQPSGGVGVGIINEFDGSDFLQDEDIEMQAHLHSDLGAVAVEIHWDNAVASAYKRSGLWLPDFTEIAGADGNFSGLVPRPWTGAASDAMTGIGGNLYEYLGWLSTVPEIVNGTDLDFFFYFASQDLYSARCEDDTASDWYRLVRPWTIKIRNVVTQAGGVSILNNIINPNRNERVSLHYELTSAGTVTIQVFDLAGGLVEVLHRGYQDVGEYAVSWNGRNRAGNAVARGIYFIRYVGPGGIDQIRKVLVVK